MPQLNDLQIVWIRDVPKSKQPLFEDTNINLDAIPAILAVFYYPVKNLEEARQVLKILIQYDNDRYRSTSLRSYGFIMKYNGSRWEHESEFYARFVAAGDS